MVIKNEDVKACYTNVEIRPFGVLNSNGDYVNCTRYMFTDEDNNEVAHIFVMKDGTLHQLSWLKLNEDVEESKPTDNLPEYVEQAEPKSEKTKEDK